ncbi:MAG: hypothetical protein GXP33_12995 [Spirochaetes bacterium]|nr:hypothetical protein [Spirochaetota bacterium]
MEKREEDIKQYWNNKETVHGEKLIYKSIAELKTSGKSGKFGILYLMEKNLYMDYSESGRKTLLDIFMPKQKKDSGNKNLTIPRDDIEQCFLIPAVKIRKMLAASEKDRNSALLCLEKRKNSSASFFLAMLYGSALCIIHKNGILVVHTPSNRKWLKQLTF